MNRDPEQAKRERAVFEAFLEAHPQLAADLVEWFQPDDDFPDVVTVRKDRRRIEWELGEWLEPHQTRAGKQAEQLRDGIKAAIGDQPMPPPKHVRLCMLWPITPPVRFNPKDAQAFLEELLALITNVDTTWPENPGWHSPQGYNCVEFDSYPMLKRYLRAVYFDPRVIAGQRREWPSGVSWIAVEQGGGWYDPQVAIDALTQCLRAKSKYGLGSTDVRLIEYYDQALIYNTPYRGVKHRTFRDVASHVAEQLREMSIPFTSVYLLHVPLREAFEIYPELRSCC